MNTNMAKGMRRGLKWICIAALEVWGLAACGDSATGPTVLSGPLPANELPIAQVSADYADTGDTILVSFDLGERAHGGERTLYATVEWDEEGFELLRASVLDGEMAQASQMEPGVLAVRLNRRDDLQEPVLVLEFRAKRSGETDTFGIRDVRAASERDGERQDDVA